jgi:thiazole biosynthesis enzyme
MHMEEQISSHIVEEFAHKLRRNLSLDVAIVGGGPSGLVAAHDLAKKGRRVAVFESRLAPGGGIWGGGMLFNEVIVQDDACPILDDFGIRHRPVGNGYHACDSVEMAAGLIFGACRAGAAFFNAVTVEDIVFRDEVVCGIVINWTPVRRLEMHVDPLVVIARAVLDGTGHPGEIVSLAARKAGVRLDTPTGAIMGEKPLWVERGEISTVENTKRFYPGLYASGMAANNACGGFRMGPIFGGMLKSGRKAAELIHHDLGS